MATFTALEKSQISALIIASRNAANVLRLAISNGAFSSTSTDDQDSAEEAQCAVDDLLEALAPLGGSQ